MVALLGVVLALLFVAGVDARAQAVPLTPKASILVDADTGAILDGTNIHTPLPPASLSKIFTALAAVAALEPNSDVPVSARTAGMPAHNMNMKEGQVWVLEDVLGALLVSSANDAGMALAERVSGTAEAFGDALDRLAARLRLADSPELHDPSGLDDEFSVGGGNKVSARDLAIAARAVLAEPRLAPIVASPVYSFTGGDGIAHRLGNHNRLLRTYPGAVGMKTGYTKRSLHSLVAAATPRRAHDDRRHPQPPGRDVHAGRRAARPRLRHTGGDRAHRRAPPAVPSGQSAPKVDSTAPGRLAGRRGASAAPVGPSRSGGRRGPAAILVFVLKMLLGLAAPSPSCASELRPNRPRPQPARSQRQLRRHGGRPRPTHRPRAATAVTPSSRTEAGTRAAAEGGRRPPRPRSTYASRRPSPSRSRARPVADAQAEAHGRRPGAGVTPRAVPAPRLARRPGPRRAKLDPAPTRRRRRAVLRPTPGRHASPAARAHAAPKTRSRI